MSRLKPARGEIRFAPLLVVWVTLLGYAIVVFREGLLPERFSYDAARIAAIARREGAGDPSYAIVGNIYRVLGLAYHETVAGIIQYTLAAGLILVVFWRARSGRITIPQASVPMLALLLSAVYLGHYSKDAFVLPIAFAICFTSGSLTGTVIVLAVMAAYAATFRMYWWLVLVTFIAVVFIYRKRMTALSWIIGFAVAAVAVALGITVVLGVPADAFRLMTNEARLGTSDASTMITPYVNLPEPAGGIVNSLTTGFLLMLPLPLLRLGGIYYLLIMIAVSMLWLTLLTSVRKSSPIADFRVRRMLALLMAFLAVQSTFEPDYGSALRHLTPLLGVLVAVISECSRRSDSVSLAGEQ